MQGTCGPEEAQHGSRLLQSVKQEQADSESSGSSRAVLSQWPCRQPELDQSEAQHDVPMVLLQTSKVVTPTFQIGGANTNSCSSGCKVTSKLACTTAASSLGMPLLRDSAFPSGCHVSDGFVLFNAHSTGSAFSGARPICGPCTATTTTTTITCTCTTPHTGTAGHNQMQCSNGETRHCGSNEACYAVSPFTYGSWTDGCAITCTCTTPNAGTAGHNQIQCTNGETRHCNSNEACWTSSPFTYGSWTDNCRQINR